jgi:hypothetical protein
LNGVQSAPESKAGEERSLFTVETNFLPGRTFTSWADLNQQAHNWATERMDHRPQGKAGVIPLKAFEQEIGYVEVEPVQVGLFFTLMHQRHQRKSTLITSNLGFSQWGSFLKNDHLTAPSDPGRLAPARSDSWPLGAGPPLFGARTPPGPQLT